MEPLEVLITIRGDKPDVAESVREELGKAAVYCLGQPAGEVSDAGLGSESDLLHFTVDEAKGVERVMLPVFTRPDVMREALLRNPDWQSLAVLQVSGRALLDNVDVDVTIVINPWTRLEFRLAPVAAA
jgi:hypothetical protein